MRLFIQIRCARIDADDLEDADYQALEEAKVAAISGIRDFIGHEVIMQGLLDLRGRAEIEDEEGRVLAAISFADAVTIDRPL